MSQPYPACPCGSGHPLTACCQPLLEGAPAPTAEALMRSRYAAHVVGDTAYLLRTWHPRTRPARIELDGRTTWRSLTVRTVEAGEPDDDWGVVAFVATYERAGRLGHLTETSRFQRRAGRWVYVEAVDGGDR